MFSGAKRYVSGVWAAVAISLFGLGLIVWKTVPDTAPLSLKILFFLSAFVFIWSVATLIIFSIKNRFARSRQLGESAYEGIFYDSLFQSFVISGIAIAAILIKRFIS